MSDLGLIRDDREPDGQPPRRERSHRGDRRAPRRRRGWLPAALVLLVMAGAVYVGGSWAFHRLEDKFAAAPDYAGPGTGKVVFEVHKGDSVAEMGRGLRRQDVVKSVDAFVDAARKEPKASTIQVGFYQLKRQMASSDALAVLVDPDNLVQSAVTVPEGSRVRSIVDAIARNTDLKRGAVEALLKRPSAIGLPASAKGNPEGYLYPATYVVPPNMTARQLLRQMVAKTVSVEQDLRLSTRAQGLGYTPEQILTVASILEYEANRGEDYPKVARVIYNRLDKGMALQLDSTVSYVSKRQGDVWTTAAERADDSRYNTYQHTGLPPGPIGSPGQATIEAALHPADGDWLYFVPDFAHNRTLFTADYQQHLRNVAKAKQYCQTHESC